MRLIFLVALLAALALWLYGCATDQAVARVETVTVDKPVAVPCLTPEQVPKAPAQAVKRAGASMDQQAAALGVELEQWRKYGTTAQPLLQSCTTLPPPKGSP